MFSCKSPKTLLQTHTLFGAKRHKSLILMPIFVKASPYNTKPIRGLLVEIMIKAILSKIAIIVLPSTLWFLLTGIGIGAQSLSNLIEVVIIFGLSLPASILSPNIISTKRALIGLLILTVLLRLFMPLLPE